MIKLGLSIDDDKIEEELPSLEKETLASAPESTNKMEEVDWFMLSKISIPVIIKYSLWRE